MKSVRCILFLVFLQIAACAAAQQLTVTLPKGWRSGWHTPPITKFVGSIQVLAEGPASEKLRINLEGSDGLSVHRMALSEFRKMTNKVAFDRRKFKSPIGQAEAFFCGTGKGAFLAAFALSKSKAIVYHCRFKSVPNLAMRKQVIKILSSLKIKTKPA